MRSKWYPHMNSATYTCIAFLNYWAFDVIFSSIQLSQHFQVSYGRTLNRNMPGKINRCCFEDQSLKPGSITVLLTYFQIKIEIDFLVIVELKVMFSKGNFWLGALQFLLILLIWAWNQQNGFLRLLSNHFGGFKNCCHEYLCRGSKTALFRHTCQNLWFTDRNFPAMSLVWHRPNSWPEFLLLFFFICQITVSLNSMYFNISSIQHLFISYKLNFNMANGFFCLMNKGTTLGEGMFNPLQLFGREDRVPVWIVMGILYQKFLLCLDGFCRSYPHFTVPFGKFTIDPFCYLSWEFSRH